MLLSIGIFFFQVVVYSCPANDYPEFVISDI